MLEEVFFSLISNYSEDSKYIALLWDEIVKNHSKKGKFYHTLDHLEHVYQNLLLVRKDSTDWDMIVFSLFYHDYVYNILKQNNEEKSALKAIDVLSSLHIETKRIELCNQIILATKGHHISENSDVNYFTDADLSILGSSWKVYESYFKNVRKEYKYYPDFAYNKGRIKVLKHFIDMPRIFKTDYFYHKFEHQAKNNLQKEINVLK
ncbi:hypothetical protein [Aquimarina sp. RZ0]|uniref:HD domain-containing protein n=1 Tax=Aquimarina sp. RZ0 TaxID=2607730 RepID=UPI0011F309B4|nr:hypothetical protein [Aquimarina sp. RZ0]KAA1247742.1 hypothetical protein F0000_02740 [Aquimarina sp. RZ0]